MTVLARGVALWAALVWLIASSAPQPTRADAALSDWAAVFVAGDWHAHSGAPSQAFDNARHDVARAFVAAGLSPDNIAEFSVRPWLYPTPRPLKADPDTIGATLKRLAAKAPGGCLAYISSHGSGEGVVLDGSILAPSGMAQILDEACGDRPTVVILSACFSGVFIPTLLTPNRLIITAARSDRSSFGCGESDRYPYFDDCILKSLSHAADFWALGQAAQACVEARELSEQLSPPSSPQMQAGGMMRPILPLITFQAPPTRVVRR